MIRVNIIGAGLAGLSAAVHLAQMNIASRLISVQTSERAQSVLAEGGINAAMDVSGENDTVQEHFEDTMRGGVWLADPGAVRGLTEQAPSIIQELLDLGVPFNMDKDALVQRRFGGQKKTRTTYARSSTGKALMTAMIDAARRYENAPAAGHLSQEAGGAGTAEEEPLIRRYSHHRFEELILDRSGCTGVRIRDTYTGEGELLEGPVILAFGGPNGLFPGRTTGTTANDADALATVFDQGVELGNLEFIQFHPTTVQISGKRMLISEAARGEGGRLYTMRGGSRWYFMEEKYPELGNLMPRDVVSREMDEILRDPDCEPQILLDLTELPAKVWRKRLPDLRREIMHYLDIDPAVTPVPVQPGIHFFMGGILVDREHRTNIPGLWAAGECACQYHGANRLGGNSLLGALYGGRVAARSVAGRMDLMDPAAPAGAEDTETASPASEPASGSAGSHTVQTQRLAGTGGSFSARTAEEMAQILMRGLGIVRDEDTIREALEALHRLEQETGQSGRRTAGDLRRFHLAEAMLLCAGARRESRGAHTRRDYPVRDDDAFRKTTTAIMEEGRIRISFRPLPSESSEGS